MQNNQDNQPLLIEDPNLAGIQNRNDRTPLMYATVNGHIRVAQLLAQENLGKLEEANRDFDQQNNRENHR